MPLEIKNEAIEAWDSVNNVFIQIPESKITIEHSLVSIEKWEAKWEKSFLYNLENKQLSRIEFLDYIRCMTLEKNVDPNVYLYLSKPNIDKIITYMNRKNTASTIKRRGNNLPSREIVTAELIYYWMITQGIPFECKKWHINRLMMLIAICSIKNSNNKMSTSDILEENRRISRARRGAK
jgi:hypothetical protein